MTHFPQPGPYVIEVEQGKKYFWCACAKSDNQPFCDGRHTGSGVVPVKLEPSKQRLVYFCGCKQTKTPPFCDGSHNALKENSQ